MEVVRPPKLLTLLKLLSVLSLPSLLWLLFCLHPFQCLHCSYCLDAVSAYTASIATLLTLLSLHKHCVQSAFQHILQHVKITQVILLCGLWIYGLWSGWIDCVAFATRAFATPIFVASATPIFVASATPYFRTFATRTAATPKIFF